MATDIYYNQYWREDTNGNYELFNPEGPKYINQFIFESDDNVAEEQIKNILAIIKIGIISPYEVVYSGNKSLHIRIRIKEPILQNPIKGTPRTEDEIKQIYYRIWDYLASLIESNSCLKLDRGTRKWRMVIRAGNRIRPENGKKQTRIYEKNTVMEIKKSLYRKPPKPREKPKVEINPETGEKNWTKLITFMQKKYEELELGFSIAHNKNYTIHKLGFCLPFIMSEREALQKYKHNNKGSLIQIQKWYNLQREHYPDFPFYF